MTTKSLSPEEQLKLIEKTIAQAKENLSKVSFPFIFWGWLVSLTALVNYLLIKFGPFGENSYLIWPVSIIIGTIYIVLYYRRAEKTEQQLTHLEYFLSRMWMVLGLVLFLFSFSITFTGLSPWLFFPFVAGLGTLISGVVLKSTPLSLGGLLLLAFPFYSANTGNETLILLYAIVVIVAYLIPAYLLKRRSA